MFEKLNPFVAGPSTTSEITELRVYPIKSCRGISVKKSFLTKKGIELDRRWMFVDAETLKFITIRDISEMTLIDTALASSSPKNDSDSDSLVISIRHTDKKVIIPSHPTQTWLQENTTLHTVNIWEYLTDGYVYQDSINSIFTEFFRKPVKLVYKGPTPRILRGNGAPEVLGREEHVNFPDVLPLLIANEASIRELNGRLKQKGHEEIEIERFRPNIIVRGASFFNPDERAPKAWSEDTWKTVKILSGEQNTGLLGGLWGGERGLEIDVAARCTRCQVPNVDPETAEKDQHEPWDTLMSYRRVDEGMKWKPCFGMLSVPRNEGPIAVGMKFEVTETTESHKYIKGF